MPTAKVTSKGQITVPASVRHALHVESGDLLAFEVKADYVVVRRQKTIREVSDAARALTAGHFPVYDDDDEAILSAFEHIDEDELGDELYIITAREEDLA